MLRRPMRDRAVGDVIPYFDRIGRRYHLFYLAVQPGARNDDRLRGVTWEHVSSTNLIDWLQHPTAIRADQPYDRDGAYTGCVIEVDGKYHLYYTGVDESASHSQTICHAVSSDLVHFEKDPANPVLAAPAGFEAADWRDPFVIWNAEAGEHWMLVSTRSVHAADPDRGVLARARSRDLVEWTIDPQEFVRPNGAYVPECAEIHQLEGRWVLAYSTFTGRSGLNYLVADSIAGPWRPIDAHRDGARWYAGKSLLDADGRLVTFGWIPERADGDNEAILVWGGDLAIPREIRFDEAGHLAQYAIAEAFNDVHTPLEVRPLRGQWYRDADGLRAAGSGALATLPPLDPCVANVVRMSFRWHRQSGEAGVLIHTDEAQTRGLRVAIDRRRSRVELQEVSQEHTHMVVAARGPWVAHELDPGLECTDVEVVLDGSCVEVFIDQRMTATHRFYVDSDYGVRVYAEGASVTVSNASLSALRASALN